MTVANITSGFKVTGVYPVNREAISLPDSDDQDNLAVQNGLEFIPLCSASPAPKCTEKHAQGRMRDKSATKFTEEEITLFEKRFENGYNLTIDARYNTWLREFHQESAHHVHMQPMQQGCNMVSKFLQCPPPPSKLPTLKPKSCGRVLTSSEHLALVEQKEKEKMEREKAKEERIEARKQKTLAKSQKALAKSQKGVYTILSHKWLACIYTGGKSSTIM